MRARLAIKLCGLKCEIREISLKSKHKIFLNLSPKGTVPVLLLQDGTIIEESLEIIEWAISQQDPLKLITKKPKIYQEDINLIKKIDNEFKFHLDRYKYSSRYEDASANVHKLKARDILVDLNSILENRKWLRGKEPTLSDISILPFVRQYRIADIEWFDEKLDLPNIKNWVHNFINSSMFINIMTKNKTWETNDPITFL
tara:strand:+ start:70 stop:669 length:600 start_codon:yes stop_codon:yes gene_type:complete